MTGHLNNGYRSGAVETFGASPIKRFTRRLAATLIVAVLVAGCQSSPTFTGPAGTPSDPSAYASRSLLVSATWLHDHLNDPSLRIVDLSSIGDYQQGHIPGAVHLWWQDTIEVHNDVYGMMVGESGVQQMVRAAGITPDSNVVLYDASGGQWAARLLWVLNANGFPNVSILNGGRQAWLANRYQMTTTPPNAPPGHLDLALNYHVLIGSDTVMSHLKDSSYVVVDNRTTTELQQTWYGRLRPGRIPGAKSVPWAEMTTGGSVPYYQSPENLQALFRNAGVEPDETVVVYGLDGVTAAQTYFVLKLLGYPSVLLYDGSWAQWGSSSNLPIEPLPPSTGRQAIPPTPASEATP